MITIRQPETDEVRCIQEREGAYYWSGCAEVILRKHGLVIKAANHSGAAGGFQVVLRNAWGGANVLESGVYEGPLEDAVLSELGLTAENARCRELHLRDSSQQALCTILYSRFYVKRIPRSMKEKTEPHEYLDIDPRWHPRDIAVQFFKSLPSGWKALAFGETESGRAPVIVSNGRLIIMGLPLFDIFGFTHAMPALDEGFYKPLATSYQFSLERWLVTQISEHANVSNCHCANRTVWPEECHAALSIRHDYDRSISDDQLDSILRFYAKRGIRATWFLLVDKPPTTTQIHAMLAIGHEVALHSAASTFEEFFRETIRFRELAGVNPLGFTCHGGIGSSGHLALTHNRWALSVGMSYGEMLGRCRGLPHPLLLPRNDIPSWAPLMVQNCHNSLDLTTRPDGHQLDKLRQDVPKSLAEGTHVTIMNHPDIHWNELQELIRSLNLGGVWCATIHDVICWVKEHAYAE